MVALIVGGSLLGIWGMLLPFGDCRVERLWPRVDRPLPFQPGVRRQPNGPGAVTTLRWEWLGTVPYGEALIRQRARRHAVQAEQADEVIWLLEHPPVVTTGRRPAPGTPDAQTLAAHGVELHATERGGLATYHAPGQLVAYLILDIGREALPYGTSCPVSKTH